MKLKERHELHRTELARMLRDWAEKLDTGAPIPLAGMETILPDALTVTTAYKEKDGAAKVKLKLEWPVGDGAGVRHQGKGKKADIAWIKKEMGRLLTEMRRKVAIAGDIGEDARRFHDLSVQFLQGAKPAWRPGAEEVVKVARRLAQEAGSKDSGSTIGLIDDLDRLKRDYHQSYK